MSCRHVQQHHSAAALGASRVHCKADRFSLKLYKAFMHAVCVLHWGLMVHCKGLGGGGGGGGGGGES